jgi:tight adherence protein B
MMNDTWIKAVVLVCTFGAVMLAAEALGSWYASSRSEGRAINLRLKLIGEGRTRGEALTLLRRSMIDLTTQVPPALIPLARKFDQMMTATQLTVPAGRVLLALLLSPVAVFLAIVALMLTAGMVIGFGRILLVATFAVLIGGVLPLMVLQFKANRTRKRMQDQFPVALDVFVRGLRAGHPIAAALDLLTVEMPDPIGTQFGIVVDEVTYGADLRDALQGMAERWNLDDMRMFVVSLSVQSETGGNLAEILENLSKVIRERASMMMKVRALSSEGRLTGIMLTALPALAFTILFVANPRFYLDVSDDAWFVPGFVMLIILYLVGFFTIRRMVDLKV